MLIVKTKKEGEGSWFKFTIRGETVELKIRPLSAEIINDIRKRHRIVKMERDPQTRQMVRVEQFDEDAIVDEITDWILEDFRGFADEDGNPLPPTLENKKLVAQIPPTSGETISISDFIFEKARELSALSEAEYKRLEKN